MFHHIFALIFFFFFFSLSLSLSLSLFLFTILMIKSVSFFIFLLLLLFLISPLLTSLLSFHISRFPVYYHLSFISSCTHFLLSLPLIPSFFFISLTPLFCFSLSSLFPSSYFIPLYFFSYISSSIHFLCQFSSIFFPYFLPSVLPSTSINQSEYFYCPSLPTDWLLGDKGMTSKGTPIGQGK